MLAELRRLVEAESPSAEPALVSRCLDVAAEIGEAHLGARPQRLDRDGRPHLAWPSRDARPVLLLMHADTVWPAGTLARWPFSVGQGRASGPGVYDMKAGIVQGFHALGRLPPEMRALVTVLLTSDEELGSPTSRRMVEEHALRARAALVLEPAAGRSLKVARKGVSMYRCAVRGRAAHAGEPQRGVNAIVEMARLVLEIASLSDSRLGTTVTPTVVAGGTAGNTVPATAAVAVDVRAATAEEQRRVDRALHGLRPSADGATVKVTGGPNRPPMPRASSVDLFELAVGCARRLGLPALRPAEVGGGSDGNFTAAAGAPTLDGLGAVGDHAHAEGEHVLIEAMPQRTALVAELVRSLVAPEGAGADRRWPEPGASTRPTRTA
jgi:glutamate carboxypeptidase